MPYVKQNGEFADTEDVTLAASAARTTDSQGAGVELGDRGVLRATLDVTAASGTLMVSIETSADGSTWREVGAFTGATGTGSQRLSFAGLDRYVRAKWAITTSGSFTFSVTGEAV